MCQHDEPPGFHWAATRDHLGDRRVDSSGNLVRMTNELGLLSAIIDHINAQAHGTPLKKNWPVHGYLCPQVTIQNEYLAGCVFE